MARRLGGTSTPKRCTDPYVGTPTGYRHHCEKRAQNKNHRFCEACREAIRIHHADYRKRRVLNGAQVLRNNGSRLNGGHIMVCSAGTRRRLQALGALGWGWEALGRKLGISGSAVRLTAIKDRPILPETEAKVRALYEELSMLPPRQTREVKLTRTRFDKYGWVPPLGWDDENLDNPYALPSAFANERKRWLWFTNTATMTERIEWVLENGFPKQPH